jgi:tetratricopeptide (TPR) repeat protein
MTSNPEDRPADGRVRITPAEVRLSGGAGPQAAPAAGRASRRHWIRVIAVLLAVTAAGVVFVLPRQVSSPQSPPAIAALAPAAAVPPAHPPAQTQVSPWNQAQLAQLRKESQDVLARLLEVQSRLKKMSVERWAGADYAAALQLAADGDAVYRSQQFEAATGRYREALAGLQRLEERADAVYAEHLKRGEQALAAGDAAAAADAFATALLIRPGDPAAARGAGRAGTLDEVMRLVDAGTAAREDGRFEEAADEFQRALALDGDSEPARSGLDAARQAIAERDFTAAMSRGYAALDRGELEAARRAFADAGKLKPGAPDARDGMRLAENRITSARIERLLAEARSLEDAEDWKHAAARYDEALKLDASLAPGQQGKARAAARAALDERLLQAIARPERLSDDPVHAEAAALLRQASTAPAPGPRLKKQIAVLGALLEQALVPVTVMFRSDNATDVTIYRVSNLGRFDTTQLALRPGRYVAAGTRPGYRDVRVEFTVAPDKPAPPVVVQCEDRI